MQRVTRGQVVTQAAALKDVALARKDSDEVSSDHLSVNNMNHLRRGYVAPVNSGCVSESDYTLLPMPPANLMSSQPHTSSPACAGLPQFIDVSPLVAAESHHPSRHNQVIIIKGYFVHFNN
jgi:hypothetical protein